MVGREKFSEIVGINISLREPRRMVLLSRLGEMEVVASGLRWPRFRGSLVYDKDMIRIRSLRYWPPTACEFIDDALLCAHWV